MSLGLLKYQKGEILYNGKKHIIDDGELINNPLSIKYLISHVSQNFYLINGSIKDNICFSSRNKLIDMPFLKKVIRISQLNNLIEELPLGLNTLVGENGIKLSGGQRQRIAIARALYRKPSFLILDEATSALDSKTENKLMNEIHKISSKMILIIVAHRTNTIKSCDQIIRIEKGEITEIGPPKNIL